MYTDVKTPKGFVRVHHGTMSVMYKSKGDQAWRWMERTDSIVAHRRRKVGRAGRAVQRRAKRRHIRLVQ
jgi:hypothetical protein